MSSLTALERQILALVASCKTNKEIAKELRFSEKTIKNYLATIF
ncbi:MAG: helix-turn-helix transcriptional regulator, partial [Nitrospirota bacterium]